MAMISAFSKFVLLFFAAHVTSALNSILPVVHMVSNVTLISGKEGTLTCKYNRTVFAVYWRYESTTSPIELLIALDKYYEDGKRSGPGYDEGRFDMTDDYSLIFHDVLVTDEGKYMCEVSDYETGSALRNHTDVTTVVIAEQPFVRIQQCEEEVSADKMNEPCVLHTISDHVTVQLTCTVVGAKPLVDLTWEASMSSEQWKQVMNESTLTTRERRNGIFDQSLTVNVDASHIKLSKQHFTCVAKGLAVDGMANYTITVYRAKGSSVTLVVVISVLCTLLVTSVIIGVYWTWWRMRAKRREKGEDYDIHQDASTPLNQIDGDAPENKGESDAPPAPKRDRRPSLETRRAEIRKYQPIMTTTTNNCINIGVFGIVTAEKASFINSLIFALTGNYPEPDVGATAAESKKYGNFKRESIELTDHINIINFKGMMNFDLDQLAKFYREIRGKDRRKIRGILKETSKTKVYCPLFICDYSNFKERCGDFMRRLSDDVCSYFGRGITVVVTKKSTIGGDDAMDKIKEELSEATGVTKRQIWIFENYTRDNHKEDVERSIEFLDFILHCLDEVKGNLRFRKVRRDKKTFKSKQTHHIVDQSSESDSEQER